MYVYIIRLVSPTSFIFARKMLLFCFPPNNFDRIKPKIYYIQKLLDLLDYSSKYRCTYTQAINIMCLKLSVN